MNQHVVFYSGGLGSYGTAVHVAKKHGVENMFLVFTDTLIEDNDLYRFLIETAGEFYNIKDDTTKELANKALKITEIYTDMDKRKEELEQLRLEVNTQFPQFIWLSDQQDPWDIFFETKFLGNSRIARCSHALKQDMSKRYVWETFNPNNTTLYLGIDWTESHRTKAPTENWAPYDVEFPLCEEPYVNKIDIVKHLESTGIRIPRLYEAGALHNNCSSFCVRQGHGGFVHLLQTNPSLYLYHEDKEQEFRETFNRDVSIMRKTKNKKQHTYTMKQLRLDWQSENNVDIDLEDIGGCGCFVDYSKEE